jgi:head-tail adaptor
MLTSAELAWMIDTENQAMASTAIIQSPVYTSGTFGSVLQSYSNVGTVSCDIWPIKQGVERSSGNQELSQGEFYISVPYNTSVTVQNRLVIDSKIYEVTFVPLSQSWLTNLRIEARNYNGA